MADQEMSYEELQQNFFQVQGQLEHQVMVNQELQKALGEHAGKNANLQVAVNSLQAYANQLEQKLAEAEKPKQGPANRATRRQQAKDTKKQPTADKAK
jgi:predicted nuclease with TOPRIM domain